MDEDENNHLSLDEQLYLAVQKRSKHLARKLLAKGATGNYIGPVGGRNALAVAIMESEDEELAEMLLDVSNLDAPFTGQLFHDYSSFTMAVNMNLYNLAMKMIDKGADIHHLNERSEGALYYACGIQSTTRMIRKLLDKGAGVITRTKEGNLPLHKAASNANVEILRLILEHDPGTINVKDENGRTAIHRAIICEFDDHIDLLLQYAWVDLNTIDKDGMSPLLDAIIRSREDITKKLLANNASAKKGKFDPVYVARKYLPNMVGILRTRQSLN